MSEFLLPKTYLSWSQMSCWMSNPERYRREYFEAGHKLDTKYLRFGKGIAELIESGKHKELLPDLEVYEKQEYEIKTTVRGVPVLSYLDTYSPRLNIFREYKTGKVAWTPAKVIKHGQLIFYATVIKNSTGDTPEECWLDWIKTEDGSLEVEDFWRTNEKTIQVTGEIRSFHRPIYEAEIEKMEELIFQVATEISDAYKEFIKEI